MTEKDQLIERGSNVKTKNLIEQASYTIKLAHGDNTALQDAGLTGNFLTEFEELVKEVINLAGKQESSKDNISLNVASVGEKLAEANEWIKKARLKARRVFRLNRVALNDFYTDAPAGRSVPNTIAAMIKLIELNKKYSAELSIHNGGDKFAAEGERILSELREIDGTKELAKKTMPESSRELYHKQGLLYFRIKDINDMGREIFISDSVKSRQYNMEILNRGGTVRKKVETPSA